jgi:16S rRNA (adenine1518-N6/adenine1519-N6)-dimethyltransferase
MRPSEIDELLARHGIVPKKGKGQNFLIDERVAERHIRFAGIEEGDTVLEVGPGLGILTERLFSVAKQTIAIELDAKLAAIIRERLPEVELIEGDALKVPFPRFDRFVSNLPYSVSTPIIFKLLEHDFKRAVVMVQKEFAERMVAKPGELDYCRLSVNVYYRAECEILETVPASRFKPRPKVDSALVSLVPRPPPFKVRDEALYLKLVDALFQHRRKKIRTILRKRGWLPEDESSIPYLDERVETLAPEEIGELADAISGE